MSGSVKELGKWLNAVAEAWNIGIADWAYVDGVSVTVFKWNEAFILAKGTKEERYREADLAVKDLCKQMGVSLKKMRM